MKFTPQEEVPSVKSGRKKVVLPIWIFLSILSQRRKNKQAKVETDDKVSIQAPLDPAVFEQMDEDETVSQIQQQSKLPSYLTKMP